MDAAKIRPYFLLAIVVGALALAYFVLKPFLAPLALAMVFAVVLYPLYAYISKYTKSYKSIASLLTVLVSALCLLIPLFFLSTLIFNQAVDVYVSLAGGSGQTFFTNITQTITATLEPYIPGIRSLEQTVAANVGYYAQEALGILINNLGPIVSGITSFFLGLFIFFIALYYLLKDGPALKRHVVDLSPLKDTDDEAVFARLERAINSVIKGNLTIALIQGTISGIGYTIFGLPNSVLWGTSTAFAALIPGVGTSLVMIPAVLYLYLTGSALSALGLLLWGTVAVGLIDNLLGPRLIGRGVQIHPLVILLSVLGGLAFFGPIGIFLGPISVSLLVALLSIYSARTTEQAS